MIPALLAVLAPIVGKVLDKIPNPAEREKARLEIELQLKAQEVELLKLFSASDSSQTEINKLDAVGNLFQRSWRPALCWAGVIGIWWTYVIAPILTYFYPARPLPSLVNDGLMELVLMLLGFGGMRLYQKTKGLQ